MLKESRSISVTKTARYWTLGPDKKEPSVLIFLLHGYAMSAEDCLNRFSALKVPDSLLVAPEGLSRFYGKGFDGPVVASWMTREEREAEIHDHVNYLHQLRLLLINQFPTVTKVIVVGFSQGVATACRWIAQTKGEGINLMVIFAGTAAQDAFASGWPEHVGVIQVEGDNDEFIPVEKFESQIKELQHAGVSTDILKYRGKHRIYGETVMALGDALVKYL